MVLGTRRLFSVRCHWRQAPTRALPSPSTAAAIEDRASAITASASVRMNSGLGTFTGSPRSMALSRPETSSRRAERSLALTLASSREWRWHGRRETCGPVVAGEGLFDQPSEAVQPRLAVEGRELGAGDLDLT